MEINDLVIVGGGPAGLSAAINGASELQKVVLVDSGKKLPKGGYKRQLGGQAIGSALIENYAGFPEGISGCDLMSRFVEQARGLGTQILCPEHASSLELIEGGYKKVTTREGSELIAKAVILCNGLSYRKLTAEGLDEHLGRGVMYGVPTSNPRDLGKCTVCIVGGANSAGQAAMHLSQNPQCSIKILIRGTKSIESEMSRYLVNRIRSCDNIEVLEDVTVIGVIGWNRLKGIRLSRGDGSRFQLPAEHLFIFIGADPKVEWLQGAVMMDSRNFIATGEALGTLYGPKLHYETSIPGVFAAGDIRHGSIKRVSAAAGEGSGAVALVHQYLSQPQK